MFMSPIPYMGNKYKLLKEIIPLFPDKCDTFIDLFGGSGVVSMNYQGEKETIYNEINPSIVGIVKMIVENDPKELDEYWNRKIDFYKLPRLSVKAKDEILARAESFNKFRSDYNNSKQREYKDLLLLSCYSINHLIRFNSDNQFNASNGKNAYNWRNYECVRTMHHKFQKVKVLQQNALELDLSKLDKNTFIYCDPPYLNTEAVYNEKQAYGGWNIQCDMKLFAMLEKADKIGIKWGLSNVFENRGTRNEHLVKWCDENHWKVYHLHRNYNPFSKGNSNNDEVYITNFANTCEQLTFDCELIENK